MVTMVILSRDAEQYRNLLGKQNLQGLHILGAYEDPAQVADHKMIDILLADPDLAALIIKKCHRLKWLQSTWAGNKPLFDCNKRDYQLCGVKDVFGQSMVEYVFAYLLYFARNIPGFADAQKNARWLAPEIGHLQGRTLGIMGLGSIGSIVAKAAKTFAMQVHGFTHSSNDCAEVDRYYAKNELNDFASSLDYLLCLLPDTQSTWGILDKAFLDSLPNHCVLINAGRGQCLDEHALLDVLRSNQLRAAVLDVTIEEPLPPEHPFWHTDNLYLSQHTAAISKPQDISSLFISNYHRHTNQQELKYRLDFSRGY